MAIGGPGVPYAMIGGGEGAFIGAVHRSAARLDGSAALVAGCFSRNFDNTRRTAASLGLSEDRAYTSWEGLLDAEARRPDEEKPAFVAIVTPNDTHAQIATSAIERGFAVLSDKPAARNRREAETIAAAIEAHGGVYGLTHTYLGYPMVAQASAMIARGDIGQIRRADVRYVQGWLSAPLEEDDATGAAWRTDPSIAGEAGGLGDIGTHAATLIEYVTNDRIERVSADAGALVPGRRLDDDAGVLLRMSGGARGCLTCSQIANGEENGLSFSVYGATGCLSWHQEEPNTLHYRRQGMPGQRLRAGVDHAYLSDEARAMCRTPSGHPEGYLEAFANLYRAFTDRLINPDSRLFMPGIREGLSGHAFVEAVLENSKGRDKWTTVSR